MKQNTIKEDTTMTMRKTQQIVCVRCSHDVHGPVRGATGTRHTGHVDARLDKTCGTWGYRPARPSEREDWQDA